MALSDTDSGRPPRHRATSPLGLLSEKDRDALLRPLLPSLMIGGTAGTTGVIVGYFAGLASSPFPRLFATVMGLQWFGLSSTFWYARSVIILKNFDGSPTPRQELGCSTIGGVMSGGIMGAFRSRSHILPAAFCVGLLGLVGQKGVHLYSDRRQERQERQERQGETSWLRRLASLKWAPIQALSDEEYAKMLTDKLVRAEAEISLLDEKIAALRQSKARSDGVEMEK